MSSQTISLYLHSRVLEYLTHDAKDLGLIAFNLDENWYTPGVNLSALLKLTKEACCRTTVHARLCLDQTLRPCKKTDWEFKTLELLVYSCWTNPEILGLDQTLSPCKKNRLINIYEKLMVSCWTTNPEHMDDEFLDEAYPKAKCGKLLEQEMPEVPGRLITLLIVYPESQNLEKSLEARLSKTNREQGEEKQDSTTPSAFDSEKECPWTRNLQTMVKDQTREKHDSDDDDRQ
ncbi:hypothetical protein Tco_0496446 [Tanacetum coccineum]